MGPFKTGQRSLFVSVIFAIPPLPIFCRKTFPVSMFSQLSSHQKAGQTSWLLHLALEGILAKPCAPRTMQPPDVSMFFVTLASFKRADKSLFSTHPLNRAQTFGTSPNVSKSMNKGMLEVPEDRPWNVTSLSRLKFQLFWKGYCVPVFIFTSRGSSYATAYTDFENSTVWFPRRSGFESRPKQYFFRLRDGPNSFGSMPYRVLPPKKYSELVEEFLLQDFQFLGHDLFLVIAFEAPVLFLILFLVSDARNVRTRAIFSCISSQILGKLMSCYRAFARNAGEDWKYR